MGTGDIFRALADLCFPRECLVCGRALGMRERHLCAHCMAGLPLTHYWESGHNPLSDAFNARIQEGISAYEPYSYAVSLFYYRPENGFRNITRSLKYRGNLSSGRFFAAMLGDRLAGTDHFKDVDYVIPVPLHWTRKWRRGYNQAEIIAREIAGRLGAECLPWALRRNRATRTQTRMTIAEKQANVSGAFGVRKRALPRIAEARHVLLTDDVFTTGATLYACYRALRSCFPGLRISIAALGSVPVSNRVRRLSR